MKHQEQEQHQHRREQQMTSQLDGHVHNMNKNKKNNQEEEHQTHINKKQKTNDQEPHYFQENGLRKVEPYDYEYQTTAKKRWFDQSIYHVFSTEFHDRHPDYYKVAINSGRITVNHKHVDENHLLRNGDVIRHRTHRHEPPIVWKDKIEIVYKDDEFMVVNKPASIPVHPSGRYHFNSLISILQFEQGFHDLYLVNRLDRLTSGLVLIALSKKRSQQMMQEMVSRTIKKTYLCRVKGCFPDGEVICNQPIKTVSHKLGVNMVAEDGKESLTSFEKISFNGRTSLVLCKPKTGRTHQIRVHLQYLGFPIANDPFYCCLPSSVPQTLNESSCVSDQNNKENVDETCVRANVDPMKVIATKVLPFDEVKDIYGCIECQIKRADPIPEQLYIYLHAWKYETDDWSYECSLPDWASEDYQGDQCLEERFWNFNGLWDGKAVGAF